MCSNERGITVASNVGKVYERIINNRALKHINITDAQAGGKEGRSTTDHLLILKEIINTQKRKKKPLLLTYLDVTKAYDKAWLDGIMYALHNNGVIGPTWNIIRKLNQGLKAKIKTKDGITREINIKDSIRQGGVLSVLQYATVMDEIAKEIQKTNIGIEIPGSNTKIGCLLWMDDVLLMADNEKDLQTLLNITVNTANKYHIVFGEEKSKIMIMNSKKELKNIMKLGNMTLKTTENYKYLGEIINHKKSMTRYKCCAQHNGRVANYCHVPLVIRRVHITSTPQAIHLLALCGEVINIHLRTKKDRSRSSIFELEIHPWYKFGINATNID